MADEAPTCDCGSNQYTYFFKRLPMTFRAVCKTCNASIRCIQKPPIGKLRLPAPKPATPPTPPPRTPPPETDWGDDWMWYGDYD